MRLVVVAPRLPYPLDKGDRLTVFHLLKYFSQRHEVALVCFQEPQQDPAWVNKFQHYCTRVEVVPLRKSKAYANCALGLFGRTPLQILYYADARMRDAVQKIVTETKPDLMYAHLIRMGQYIQPYEPISRVVAMNASMTLNHRRLAEHSSGLSKALHTLEYGKVRSYEAAFARKFDRVLLISKHDFEAIEQPEPLTNVFFNPHGVDQDFFAPDSSKMRQPNTIIFTGNMNYAPNVDAAVYFCRDILPSVRSRIPDVKFLIVGADPAPGVASLARDPSVEVTGRVPDLREFMNSATIGVAPMRIGAGLQNKVLEGLSMELPMVITSVANEGIRAVNGQHVLIAETARETSEHIVRLLSDVALRQRLGRAARAFIVENWSWEQHFTELEGMFLKLVNHKRQQRSTAV